MADLFIMKFWPGQLTIVFELENSKGIPDAIKVDDTIAFRVPNHEKLLKLIKWKKEWED